MPASQEQKVDFLLKKIGYSASKTGIAEDSSLSGSTKKAPFAEAIASPLVIPSSTIWSESGLIPATPPSSNTAYVGIYTAANAYRMTYDNTVGAARRTFIARSSYGNQSSSIDGDWIDTQFGADYIVQVYKGDPNSGGVSLQQAGANAGTDGWFFDYSSGVLNFNGTNLPSGIGTDNVYVLGYRYIGRKGVQPAAGLGTFHDLVVSNNLSVGGISTFSGLIDANGIIEATAGQNKIPSLYQNFSDLPNAGTYHGMFAHVHTLGRGYFAHGGAWYELVNKESNGVVGTGTESYNIGSLVVSGVTTSGNIGISTGIITGPSVTYIDPATVGDNTGTLVIKGDLQVEGTQTVVNSSTMTVADKNIELAKGAANDAAADGGGITVDSGDGDKTWQWLDATDSWTSSENIRIANDKVFGFAGDTGLNIRRAGSNILALATNGNDRIRILQSGNVGIGSLVPKVKLDVSGDTQLEGNLDVVGVTTTTGNLNVTDGRILIAQSTAPQLRINSSSSDGSSTRFSFGLATASNNFINGASSNDACIAAPSNILFGIGNTRKFRIKTNDVLTDVDFIPSADDAISLGRSNARWSDLFAVNANLNNVSIAGVTTTVGDFNFTGTDYNAFWDESLSALRFNDNAAIRLGDSQDLQIYHSTTGGGHSYVQDTGAGNLVLDTNGFSIKLTYNDSETMLRAIRNKEVELYHDNSKKFATSGVGATVYGELDTTDLKVTGVSTFTGAIDANSNLDVAGIATIGSGASGAVTLRHQGATKLNTATWGVSVWGVLQANNLEASNGYVWIKHDNQPLKIGVGEDLQLIHDGSESFINNHTSNLNINAPQVSISTNFSVGGISTFSNTTFTGTISAGSTTGTDGYYLKTTGVGVTWAQFPTARNSQIFTATAGQTTFSFTYNVNYLDVFVNGVKLPASEFTASNGTSVVLDDGCFVNDTVELITYNTVPSSSSGAQSLNQLNDITITGSPVIGETLQHNGSAFVNDYTVSATTTSTSQTAILSLPVATYRSAEYTIQVTEGTKYHVTKVLAIHDGTNVTFNEYGTLTTSTSLSTFALDVNSGNMRLLVTPASTNSTVFKVKFTGIKV